MCRKTSQTISSGISPYLSLPPPHWGAELSDDGSLLLLGSQPTCTQHVPLSSASQEELPTLQGGNWKRNRREGVQRCQSFLSLSLYVSLSHTQSFPSLSLSLSLTSLVPQLTLPTRSLLSVWFLCQSFNLCVWMCFSFICCCTK
jgi:hypothetical protein